MARPATGREFVEAAKERIASAKTVDALRAAQALLLPLEFGLSLEQTATIIGLSKSRTGKLRTRFQRIETGQEQVQTKKGLRNHARIYFPGAEHRGSSHSSTEGRAGARRRSVGIDIHCLPVASPPWMVKAGATSEDGCNRHAGVGTAGPKEIVVILSAAINSRYPGFGRKPLGREMPDSHIIAS